MNPSNNKAPQKDSIESDPNRALKRVVISMGLFLVAGFILVFVLAIKRFTSDEPLIKRETKAPYAYRHCEQKTLALDADETVNQITFEGEIAQVVTRNADGDYQIRLLHPCSGSWVGRVNLKSPEAKRSESDQE